MEELGIGIDPFPYVCWFPWTKSVDGRKMFGLPASGRLLHLSERCGHQGNYKALPLEDHLQLSNKTLLNYQSHLAMLFFLAFTLGRQTPTHLFRFPSLVFSVLSINKFWGFSGQQNEGISLRTRSAKEMLSVTANPHDSTQLTNYRTQDSASLWGWPPFVPPKH